MNVIIFKRGNVVKFIPPFYCVAKWYIEKAKRNEFSIHSVKNIPHGKQAFASIGHPQFVTVKLPNRKLVEFSGWYFKISTKKRFVTRFSIKILDYIEATLNNLNKLLDKIRRQLLSCSNIHLPLKPPKATQKGAFLFNPQNKRLS